MESFMLVLSRRENEWVSILVDGKVLGRITVASLRYCRKGGRGVPEWFAFYIGAEWPAAMFSSELMAKDFTSKLSGMVGDLKRVPSPIVSQSELTRRVEQATADKDKRIAELEKDRDNYRRLFDDAIDAVDEVFQTRSDSAPPILPDFCPLGTSKFRAVVKLAKEYKALKQQLAERDYARKDRDLVYQCNATLSDQLAAANARADGERAKVAVVQEAVQQTRDDFLHDPDHDNDTINWALGIIDSMPTIAFPPDDTIARGEHEKGGGDG